MKFTEEQTLQFVVSYKNHPCLYDSSHEYYKNKHAREAAMWDMISELGLKGLTTDEIKKKIKSLRSTYLLEVDKIQRLKKVGENYKSRLRWFEDMSSIFSKFKVRRATDSSGATSPPAQQEYEVDNELTQEDPGSESHETSISMAEIKPSSSHVRIVSDPLKIKQEKMEAKEDSRPKKSIHLITELRDLKKELRKSNVRNSNNEYDIYGQYVAASLKKLSSEQAIFAQNEINNVLTKAKMHDLENGQATIYKVLESGDESDESLDV